MHWLLRFAAGMDHDAEKCIRWKTSFAFCTDHTFNEIV